MEDGVEAITSLNDGGGEVITNQVEGEGQELAGGSDSEGQSKGINWEKRYSDSSREALKWREEAIAAKAKLEALTEVQGSLTVHNNQQPGFIPEEQFVALWEEKGIPKDAAAFMYKERKAEWERNLYNEQKFKALENQLKFSRESADQMLALSSPDAQKAQEFFRDVPEIASLPVHEQVKRHQAIQKKLGRDLSEVKKAAGGAVGGATGSRVPVASGNSELDAMAKRDGYVSWKAMTELNNCNTLEQRQAWEAKWKKGR